MAKQGFSERLYLKLFKNKIQNLSHFITPKCSQKAFDLFCTPYPKYKKVKTPAIFHQAKKISLKLIEGIEIKGFEWQSPHPNGKTVLIAHGYASYFYKFEQ
jgi:hypothetical protein